MSEPHAHALIREYIMQYKAGIYGEMDKQFKLQQGQSTVLTYERLKSKKRTMKENTSQATKTLIANMIQIFEMDWNPPGELPRKPF